jgi:two-component system alkaline phosphatase synthesis response regulator PhoP
LQETLADSYDVESANNGSEAIARLENDIFDLVIMDFKMPGQDGLRTIEQIRKTNITIPIIIITAYQVRSDDNTLARLKVDAVYTKPLDLRTLKEKIFELLGK